MFILTNSTNVNRYGVYSSHLFLLACGVAYLKHLYALSIGMTYVSSVCYWNYQKLWLKRLDQSSVFIMVGRTLNDLYTFDEIVITILTGLLLGFIYSMNNRFVPYTINVFIHIITFQYNICCSYTE